MRGVTLHCPYCKGRGRILRDPAFEREPLKDYGDWLRLSEPCWYCHGLGTFWVDEDWGDMGEVAGASNAQEE